MNLRDLRNAKISAGALDRRHRYRLRPAESSGRPQAAAAAHKELEAKPLAPGHRCRGTLGRSDGRAGAPGAPRPRNLRRRLSAAGRAGPGPAGSQRRAQPMAARPGPARSRESRRASLAPAGRSRRFPPALARRRRRARGAPAAA